MARQKPTNPQAHDGPRLESTQGSDMSSRVKASQNAGKGRLRHPPVGEATRPLLAACRARYDASGMTLGDVTEATGLDKSDIAKALNLRAEPTARTLGGLCEYFDVATAKCLTANERKRALLISIDSMFGRVRELFGALLGEIEEDV